MEENESELGSTVNLNTLKGPTKPAQTNQLPPQQQPPMTTSAPAIDFKLNVKIEINSGKCILHANSTKNGDKPDPMSRNDHTANFYSANLNDYQRNVGLMNSFMHHPLQNTTSDSHDMRNTNFIFPAIGVKAFYESTHKEINKRLSKKANLYAMIKLESLVMPHTYSHHHLVNREVFNSRDMCISPALLDFLEQTLEPFDLIKASFESAGQAGQAWVLKCFSFVKFFVLASKNSDCMQSEFERAMEL
jgi:hypothetical protein